ncbi:MAG TPA: monofunctional biosynthetic peptidoglycan transglycosylase [Steroidobacteraceae bacterium]|nr:monofunctional biosynthetic peptidoglycan transglycosylase [Steroidobacteraceae bacterium]
MPQRKRGLARRALRGALLLVAAWVAVTIAVVVALRFVDPPTTAFKLQSRIAALAEEPPGYRFGYQWRDWDSISREAALAVVAAEDQKFPVHHGFDFEQIDRALADRERGRRVRGASTISQQVAKNLFLWPGRSLFRKGLEAGLTVLIELAWSKRRILEVYLNVAEFGPGTYGVQAASRRYFGKDAAALSRAESALLAAVLPAPRRYSVSSPSRYVRHRQDWIERQMSALGGTHYLEALDRGERH